MEARPADRIPDLTTVGDFCRRFDESPVRALMAPSTRDDGRSGRGESSASSTREMIAPIDEEVVERHILTADIHVRGTVIERDDDDFSAPTFEDAYQASRPLKSHGSCGRVLRAIPSSIDSLHVLPTCGRISSSVSRETPRPRSPRHFFNGRPEDRCLTCAYT